MWRVVTEQVVEVVEALIESGDKRQEFLSLENTTHIEHRHGV